MRSGPSIPTIVPGCGRQRMLSGNRPWAAVALLARQPRFLAGAARATLHSRAGRPRHELARETPGTGEFARIGRRRHGLLRVPRRATVARQQVPGIRLAESRAGRRARDQERQS